MTLIVNGEERQFERDMTLAQLLETLSMKADRVAVELNREITRREQWPQMRLHDGDRLEIVHFVGGGRDNAKFEMQNAKLKKATR
jgi:thiamine biosynthesis protein ThiS